ncbi:transmembrane protein 26-like [Ruditapes philippinarum]|uniref:transmembrane protein 26-like n=1 Tax=Ruditapes philippinarum TaxID=129788 RepID=UPI00295B41AB|nr:transmembrane protein 26-like [Ruditapes philippinarum]XP_060585692.1 transmembrane protein 26-like [Ruditapes philippinarum]
MGHISVARALSVRLLFASHGVVSIWRLADVTNDNKFWYLSGTLALLLLEALITLVKRQGKEWKWFCPSVFIYLLTSVPAIWFLELHEFDKRVEIIEQANALAKSSNKTIYFINGRQELQDLSSQIGSILGVRFEVRIPIKLTPDQWIRMLEQMLLLILILGRWLLPKGKLTHNQLSQLLLVYIGTAADIVEFFEAFKEKEVRHHKILCIIILGIWSLSLVQFSLVLTASRAERDRNKQYLTKLDKGRYCRCCHADVFGILISILLQDLPFLVLRMLLIFKYNVLSYTNMFFTSKNTLVIALLIYRLIVLFINRNEPDKDVTIESNNGDISLIPETSTFRRTSEKRRQLLEFYVSDNFDRYQSRPSSREYEVRPETHKWGRAYSFELVQM